MDVNKREELEKRREESIEDKEHLDIYKNYINGTVVAKNLGISEKTLTTLAEMGEFELGRIAGRLIVNKKSLLSYLDRVHLKGKEKESSLPVYDGNGKVNPHLEIVEEAHKDIPKLEGLRELAKRTSPPLGIRNFIRHCDIGTFYHYRIGTAYKMSEEDWHKNAAYAEKEKAKKRGRKTEIFNHFKAIEFLSPISEPKKILEFFNKESYREKGAYFVAELVSLQLKISTQTLVKLAQMGEFELGKINNKIIIEKKSFLSFLDRSHFSGDKSTGNIPAYDNSGNLKPLLSFSPKKHTEIPNLKKISDFILRTDPPLDARNFIRHCDIGTFCHYRIGTMYRLSEEDWTKSLQRITSLGHKTKSNRGRKQELPASSL